MSDKELLELAAKAAGIVGEYQKLVSFSGYSGEHWRSSGICYIEDSCRYVWNPLTNDGDALRLAVKLELFDLDKLLVAIELEESDSRTLDSLAATRRAIVRAAAEIGKAMP
jgi:hypothetical protein